MSALSRASVIWRERAWVWVPALLFFALNLGARAYYYGAGLGDQVSRLGERLTQQTEQDRTLSQELARLEDFKARAVTNQRRIQQLYGVRLATQEQRLTAIISEVRRLATQAGLEPTSVSYPEKELEEFGLEQKSFAFTVAGNYADLRKLINSLELTPSFLILDEIGLGQQGGGSKSSLRINLRISTLFAIDAIDLPEAPEMAGPEAMVPEAAAPEALAPVESST